MLSYAFEPLAADIEEIPGPGETPEDYALRLARSKALSVAQRVASALPVLAADTDVSVDGRILGKPETAGEAMAMLRTLSGRSHRVCSAVALLRGTDLQTRLSVTEVSLGRIDAGWIEHYARSGEPCGKAGGYAIQGAAARWVREIRGSYTAVVGLPLFEACELLDQAGIAPRTQGRP